MLTKQFAKGVFFQCVAAPIEPFLYLGSMAHNTLTTTPFGVTDVGYENMTKFCVS